MTLFLDWDDHDKFHEHGETADQHPSPKKEEKHAGGRAVVGGGIVNSDNDRPPRPTSNDHLSSKSQIEELTKQDSKLTLDQASDLIKVLQKAREIENKN